jgi:hypothetical protein
MHHRGGRSPVARYASAASPTLGSSCPMPKDGFHGRCLNHRGIHDAAPRPGLVNRWSRAARSIDAYAQHKRAIAVAPAIPAGDDLGPAGPAVLTRCTQLIVALNSTCDMHSDRRITADQHRAGRPDHKRLAVPTRPRDACLGHANEHVELAFGAGVRRACGPIGAVSMLAITAS